MDKRISIVTLVVAGALAATVGAVGDRFTSLKKQMSEAACCRFEFLSIVESDVFDATDTTVGSALIGRDGRYRIEIGPDTYLNDGRYLYSYSRPNNQVTVELANPDAIPTEEISFVTRLDEFYATRKLVKDSLYRLTLLDSSYTNLPDSMDVLLTVVSGAARLRSLGYRDINDDKNDVVFTGQFFSPSCDEGAFEAHFPDSVEIIKLY